MARSGDSVIINAVPDRRLDLTRHTITGFKIMVTKITVEFDEDVADYSTRRASDRTNRLTVSSISS